MNSLLKGNQSVLNGKTTAILATALAVLAIGCAGAGDGGSSTGTTTTSTTATGTTAGSIPVVDLGKSDGTPKPGQIELSYLTGQGRTGLAAGDITATIGLTDITDTVGRTVSISLGSPPRVQLNGYQNQILRINTEVASIIEADTQQRLNSRLFLSYKLKVDQVQYQSTDGTSSYSAISGLPVNLPASIRTFAGRYTVQPVFINDAHFAVNSEGSGVDFNKTQFDQDNSLSVQPRLPSHLSDYLAFDISGMPAADRPKLSTGEAASRIFFSGDTYSISQAGSKGLFEAIDRNNLSPTVPNDNLIEGRFAPPGNLFPASGVPSATPGTYSLIQPDPSDPFLISRITSLQGIWRNYTQMVRNMGSTFAISFPSSNDNDEQDIVFMKQTVTNDGSGRATSASIQAFYYGVVNFSAGTIRLYPVKNITSASIDGEISASVGQQYTKQGAVTNSTPATRYATYTGLSLPGFPSTGTFVVYRY